MMMMEMFFPSLSKWAHTVYHFNSWEHLLCGLVGMGELCCMLYVISMSSIHVTPPITHYHYSFNTLLYTQIQPWIHSLHPLCSTG